MLALPSSDILACSLLAPLLSADSAASGCSTGSEGSHWISRSRTTGEIVWIPRSAVSRSGSASVCTSLLTLETSALMLSLSCCLSFNLSWVAEAVCLLAWLSLKLMTDRLWCKDLGYEVLVLIGISVFGDVCSASISLNDVCRLWFSLAWKVLLNRLQCLGC